MPDREKLIQYYIGHVCDCVPYSDPDYNQKVRELAERLADDEIEQSQKNIEHG